MKNVLIALVCLFSINSYGQNDFVTFKNGKKLKSSNWINNCTKSFLVEGEDQVFVDKGVGYCKCMLERLAQNYTYDEFITIVGDGNNNIQAAERLWQDDSVKAITNQCLMDNQHLFTNGQNMKISSQEERDAVANSLKENYFKYWSKEEYQEFNDMIYVQQYLNCIVDKMFELMSIQAMINPTSKDLLLIESIEESCILSNLK